MEEVYIAFKHISHQGVKGFQGRSRRAQEALCCGRSKVDVVEVFGQGGIR
jgi:hypothetical protein